MEKLYDVKLLRAVVTGTAKAHVGLAGRFTAEVRWDDAARDAAGPQARGQIKLKVLTMMCVCALVFGSIR